MPNTMSGSTSGPWELNSKNLHALRLVVFGPMVSMIAVVNALWLAPPTRAACVPYFAADNIFARTKFALCAYEIGNRAMALHMFTAHHIRLLHVVPQLVKVRFR